MGAAVYKNTTIPHVLSTPVPSMVGFNKKIVKVAMGQFHACAITTPRKGVHVYCTGQNNHGQLGRGDKTDSSVPVADGDKNGGKEEDMG